MDAPQEDENDCDYDCDEAECNEPSVESGSSSFLLVSFEPAFTERGVNGPSCRLSYAGEHLPCLQLKPR